MTGNQEQSPQDNQDSQPLVPQAKRLLEGEPPASLMEQAGFSPLLPEHLQRLNDALKRRGPSLKSLTLELIPGESPTFRTEADYHSGGYRMRMRVFPNSNKAELAIGKFEPTLPNFGLYLQDIQQFTVTAFPGRAARLIAEPNVSLVEEPPAFDMDLQEVTEELIRPFADLRSQREIRWPSPEIIKSHGLPYQAFNVVLTDQELPLFSLHIQVNWTDATTGRVFFPVMKFYVEGPTFDIEGLLPLVTDLFDKPPDYPLEE